MTSSEDTTPQQTIVPPELRTSESSHWRAWLASILVLGLLLQVYLATRAWVAGDQAHLLSLGWRLAIGGALEPFAKMMSGAGANPGSLLQILVGLPLAVVPDHRSPLVVIALFDIGAFLILAAVMRQAIGDRAALLFMMLYWLSPWRIYHSSFLWEPQYVLLPAAMHLYGCWRARETKSLTSSVVIAIAIVLAMQLHNSFIVLVLVTVFLALRRGIKLHVPGLLIGALAAALPLIPTFVALINGTLPVARESQGFIGKGLLYVAPMLKGLLYWPRLGSLDVGIPLAQTVYLEEGIAIHGALTVLARALQVVCVLSILVVLRASWWYFAPLCRRWRARRLGDHTITREERTESWMWMRLYALSNVIALVGAAALSPITLQGWMVIIALHAAIIPVACWLDERGLRHRSSFVLTWIVALQLALMLVIGNGNRTFRPGVIPEDVRRNHPEVLHLIE